MPITLADLKVKLSIKSGTAGNQNPQTNPNQSLGKFISTTEWLGGVLHDLFDKVSGDENVVGNVEVRCIFVHNTHGTLTWENVVVWLADQTDGGADITIGVDPTTASVVGSATAQAVQAVDEDTLPAGVTFSSPTDKPGGLVLGDIAPGRCRALWIKRTPLNIGALDNDSVTLEWSGDTAA